MFGAMGFMTTMRTKTMKNFSSWIDLDCKPFYLDSKKRGLRVIVHSGVNGDVVNIVRSYLRFLRKRYFFPIRCYIHLTDSEKYRSNDKGYCFGVFFPGVEAPRHYPTIYLPAKKSVHDEDFALKLFNLTCLLTYYFQWYFKCEEDYSHRSLEIEASKAANYLLSEYFNDKEKLAKTIEE